MGAPTVGDIVFNPGANGDAITGLASAVDADPYGGAINTGITFSGSEIGALINTMIVSTSTDARYFGAAYRANIAASTGQVTGCRIYNRSGAQLNASSGVATVRSTSALDVGNLIWVVGKVSGIWVVESITLNGTSSVLGLQTWDANSVWRWEALDDLETPTAPSGTVSCSIAGQTCGIIWGSVNGNPTLMASAEVQMALALHFGDTLAGADRLSYPAETGTTAHTFIEGDYSRNTKWDGNDQSLPVPGGDFLNGTNLGFTIFQDVPADIPAPKLTYVTCVPTPFGNPQ